MLDLLTREFQTGGYDIRKLLRALVLTTAARATADAAEHAEQIEACLRDMVIATGPLDRGDAPSEALFKLLDVRHRACDLLDIDPAGHDWPTES